MNIQDIGLCEQRFLILLLDLLHLAHHIASASTEYEANASARSSVISAILSLEAAANSCLFSLGLPTKLHDELDRLPLLSKFDYFLFAIQGIHLDRGSKPLQECSAVISLRHAYVHPKVRQTSITQDNGEIRADFGMVSVLSIPADIRDWDQEVAQRILQVTVAFLNHYFQDLCKLDKGVSTTILVCMEKDIIRDRIATQVKINEDFRRLVAQHIPEGIGFIDFMET